MGQTPSENNQQLCGWKFKNVCFSQWGGNDEREQHESEIQGSCKTDAFWFCLETLAGPSMPPVPRTCTGTCRHMA